MSRTFYFLLLTFCAISCLEPIDIDLETQPPLLVVDGTFTNSEEMDEVRLSLSVDYGQQIFEPVERATVTIYQVGGASELLIENEAGVYQFQKRLVGGKEGEEYYLEIQLENGEIYRSTPELLRAAPPIDRFSYDISTVEETNDFGRVVTSYNFNLSVQSTINTENQTDFFRWEVENIYLFEKPYLYYRSFPPDPCPKCYITQTLDPQFISLIDGRLYDDDATIEAPIATKGMDFTFAFAQSFRVAQYNIGEEAFNYWSDINSISNPDGSIFDVPPATVRGNITCVDDESAIVLGYFSVAGVTRSTLFITPEETFEFYQPPPFCGLDPRTPTEVLHPYCYDCMIIENSSKDRPRYW